jgi:phosphatidylglycerophosphate synthase
MARRTTWDFYAMQRGGGLLTEVVSQRLGAALAMAADRLRLSPSVLSLANLLAGVGGSIVAVAAAGRVADGALPAWPVGLVTLLAWHLAYGFDCADGQLARATGRASPAGARLDILCDLCVQIGVITAVAVTAMAHTDRLAAWVIPVFAGTWLVNLITSVLAGGATAASLIRSTGLAARIVKLARDYAAIITLCGLVIALRPQWSLWLVAGFTVANGGFLVASVVQALRAETSRR